MYIPVNVQLKTEQEEVKKKKVKTKKTSMDMKDS